MRRGRRAYPDRPVKIIVPTVAAGTVDLVTRVMANDLDARLGQNFFVENRSGAGNTIGSREVAHSEPDGYTLLDEQRQRRSHFSAALQGSRLRCAEKLRADCAVRRGLGHSGGQSFAAVPHRGRSRRLRESQSRKAQLWLGWHRHGAAPDRRAFQDGRRHRHRARALPRRRAVDPGCDRGQSAIDLRGVEPVVAAYRSGSTAPTRRA